MTDINPPKELVQQWSEEMGKSNNPSKYMRECFLKYGYEQGLRARHTGPMTDGPSIAAELEAQP